MAEGKGEGNEEWEKIWAALQSGTENIIQGVTGSKEEGSGNICVSVSQNEGRCWT